MALIRSPFYYHGMVLICNYQSPKLAFICNYALYQQMLNMIGWVFWGEV